MHYLIISKHSKIKNYGKSSVDFVILFFFLQEILGTCSFVEMLKGYMIWVTLGTPGWKDNVYLHQAEGCTAWTAFSFKTTVKIKPITIRLDTLLLDIIKADQTAKYFSQCKVS